MDILTTALPWADMGWGAVVVLVVVSIIRGWLIPRPFHQEVINDRDRWRTMAEELQKENNKLLVIGELGVNSIYAIERVVEEKLGEQGVKKRPRSSS
jgi:hypothetical protein